MSLHDRSCSSCTWAMMIAAYGCFHHLLEGAASFIGDGLAIGIFRCSLLSSGAYGGHFHTDHPAGHFHGSETPSEDPPAHLLNTYTQSRGFLEYDIQNGVGVMVRGKTT